MKDLFDLTHKQVNVIAVLCVAALALAGYHVTENMSREYRPAPVVHTGTPAAATFEGAFVVDINSAPAESLELISGIGPHLAETIVRHRSMKRFEKIEDILQVPGIGPRTLEKIKPFIKVSAW